MFSLLEKHLQEPFKTWKQAPTPQNADTLLKAVDPIVNEGLRTFGGTVSNSPNLRSKARQLTLGAMERYDPRQAKMKTHLLSQLQSLRRHASRESQLIRVPERSQMDHIHIQNSEDELRQKLGRDPSDTELADHSRVSVSRLNKLRQAYSPVVESMASQNEDGGSWGPAVVSQPTGAVKDAWLRFVYHDLDPRDQVILEHSLGMNGKQVLSNQDLAKKLRLSPGAVSQHRLKIQQQLDWAHATGLFGG